VPDPIPLEVGIVVANLKSINHQVLIKFWQKCFKQEAKNDMRCFNSLIIFASMKSRLISGRSLLLYKFKEM
jgi:hypothetical protein